MNERRRFSRREPRNQTVADARGLVVRVPTEALGAVLHGGRWEADMVGPYSESPLRARGGGGRRSGRRRGWGVNPGTTPSLPPLFFTIPEVSLTSPYANLVGRKDSPGTTGPRSKHR